MDIIQGKRSRKEGKGKEGGREKKDRRSREGRTKEKRRRKGREEREKGMEEGCSLYKRTPLQSIVLDSDIEWPQ